MPTVRALLTFVIAGLATGSVYGLAAMGLVLTYKTSGVFNFAHGAVGAIGAYAFYEVSAHTWHLPWPVGAALAVFGAGPLLGLLLSGVTSRLNAASSSMKVVAMVGVLLVIEAGATLIYGPTTRFFPAFLPSRTFQLGGVFIGADQLILVSIGVVSAVALSVFFRVTRLGMSMRAVVDNSELLVLTGTDARRVQRASWMIGSAFAVLSGVLLAPSLGLQAAILTLLVIQAFGAAALGRFSSLPLTFVGGLVIGISANLASGYIHPKALAGLPPSMPFLALFLALIVLRQPRVAEPVGGRWSAVVRSATPRARAAGMAVAALVAALAPFVIGYRVTGYNAALIFGLLFLSLGFLVRVSGQTSLCHAAFAAVGAAALPHLAGHGFPWLLALLVGGLITGAVGAVVAIPAIRLSGLYLSLATLALGLLFQNLLYARSFMFGSTALDVPRPAGFTGDRSYYYLCLLVLMTCVGLVVMVQRSRLGRLLQGAADAPVALNVFGTSVTFLRVTAFVLSAFLAGIAGGLLAALYGSINGLAFNPFLSLTLLAVLAVAGAGTVRAAVIASVAFSVIPSYINNAHLSEYLTLLFGVTAVAVALASTRPVRDAEFESTAISPRGRSPVAARMPGLATS